MRLAALNKEEHRLEMERKKVRDAATKNDIALTEKQIDAIACANVAARESRTAEGKNPKKEKIHRLKNSTRQFRTQMIAQRHWSPRLRRFVRSTR
ncbi:hypothetical protein CES85_3940 [Ochrobactrum quorumnocens]|uniref:Uncharacterized protein n=1 Tax=Ochrobactrum quorumnocens TaxID=271865 RepID=A0A248U998_9HYPH|nr:hypothetical protein [[Ochrobactrum] quorumnocens]ASV83162.1 hypothetical protein CES85_3940 [[Ochrobactrum] quorumnocens]